MKYLLVGVCLAVLSFSCQPAVVKEELGVTSKGFDQELAAELSEMKKVDQIAAFVQQGEYKTWSRERWESFKDSVFTTHQQRLEEIFEESGFPGYDLVGKDGSTDFWLMVQHSDHVPDFQAKVLSQMKAQVDKGNADPANYGLLVDRVNLNTGKPQIYGTQVAYRAGICQAYSQDLADSANVNQRRKSIGLPPLEEYLNQMSEMHFEINKAVFLGEGITGPTLYELK